MNRRSFLAVVSSVCAIFGLKTNTANAVFKEEFDFSRDKTYGPYFCSYGSTFYNECRRSGYRIDQNTIEFNIKTDKGFDTIAQMKPLVQFCKDSEVKCGFETEVYNLVLPGTIIHKSKFNPNFNDLELIENLYFSGPNIDLNDVAQKIKEVRNKHCGHD